MIFRALAWVDMAPLIGRAAREVFSTNQKQCPDVGSDASSEWNFYACCSDVIFAGKPVVTSQNVDCFLRLPKTSRQNISRLSHAATAMK